MICSTGLWMLGPTNVYLSISQLTTHTTSPSEPHL